MEDMEGKMPELVDDTDSDDSGQACLNNMGDTTESLSQSINVTFEVDNENSRITPSNPHVLLRDVNQEQSQGDRLVALSDKL